jgi:hypothetical protein
VKSVDNTISGDKYLSKLTHNETRITLLKLEIIENVLKKLISVDLIAKLKAQIVCQAPIHDDPIKYKTPIKAISSAETRRNWNWFDNAVRTR